MNSMHFFISIVLIFMSHAAPAKKLEGQWQVKGPDIMVGLSTNPQLEGDSRNIVLAVGYPKEFNCKPVVSLIAITGTKLGSPTRQRTSKAKKNQLVIEVGSREYTGETKMTDYTNGFEMAMFGTRELIDALSDSSRTLSVRVGELELLSFSRVANFDSANRQARANCK